VKRFLLSSLLVFYFASLNAVEETTQKLIDSAEFFLLMVKQENQLSLRSYAEPQKIVLEWKAITGAVPGDKEVEGDKKTPEGIYFVTGRIPQSQLLKLHGALAFSLGYPNDFDKFKKKTGSGIWIHGVDNESRMEKRFDTRGCIALSNKDVTELGSYLHYGTPVIIINTKEELTQWNLEKGLSGPIGQRLQNWADAWASKDIEKYISFYNEDFKSRGMGRDAWKTYKNSLNKAYSNIQVQLANALTIEHPKYRISLFNQKYESNRYRAEGLKEIVWVKGSTGEWQILLEEGYQQKTGYIR
jgi:murein L,D-transpeptidase YafK